MLTRFFELAANDARARSLNAQEVVTHYRFTKPTQQLFCCGMLIDMGNQWNTRRRQTDIVIGRMVYCSMAQL